MAMTDLFLNVLDGDASRGVDLKDMGPQKRSFVKDLISVGSYTHPEKGFELEVTRQTLDDWVLAFREMQRNGVKVEVVKDHSFDADDVLGYVTSMYRQGDTLYGVHELVGDDSIALAQRCTQVSVWIDQDYVDGKGVRYGPAIVHSAVVQQPVVPGQGGFVPLSVRGQERQGLCLTRAPQRRSEDVDTKELMAKLRKAGGFEAEVTDDQVAARALSRVLRFPTVLRKALSRRPERTAPLSRKPVARRTVERRAAPARRSVNRSANRGEVMLPLSKVRELLLKERRNVLALSRRHRTGSQSPLARHVDMGAKADSKVVTKMIGPQD